MTWELGAILGSAGFCLWCYLTSPTYRYRRAVRRQDRADLRRLRGHR